MGRSSISTSHYPRLEKLYKRKKKACKFSPVLNGEDICARLISGHDICVAYINTQGLWLPTLSMNEVTSMSWMGEGTLKAAPLPEMLCTIEGGRVTLLWGHGHW